MRKDKHGMDFVIIEVIKQLQKLDTINEYFILVAPGKYSPIEASKNFKIIELNYKSYPLWEQVGLPRAINIIKPDILHCTSNTAPIFCKVPLVLTLHDVIFMGAQKQKNVSQYQALGRIYRRFVVPKIITNCKLIITVSNYEKEQILRTMPQIVKDRIISVYNGFNTNFYYRKDFKEIVKQYINLDDCMGRYFFFLGNTDPKKNTIGTLKGYANYVQRVSKPAKLLVADFKKENMEIMLKENGLGHILSYVITVGYVLNTHLPYIYSGAQAFLYTSLRESFGIPLLEAMACAVPVISSNCSAIPEVAGEGALLVDPLNQEQIGDALFNLETCPQLKQKYIDYGLNRVKHFSWENSAKAYLNIYEQINSKK